jgi:hypothetical protein
MLKAADATASGGLPVYPVNRDGYVPLTNLGGGDHVAEETQAEEQDQSAAELAQEKDKEREQARETVKEMEEGDPPKDLEDWPDDAAKYETFGGPEGEHGYHEGPEEEKLGPSSLRHTTDGGVKIAGEEVDDPDEYKGDPIPGGPTDPDAPQDLTSQKISERQGRDGGDSSDDDESSEDDDSSESESDSESESKAESNEDDSPDSKSSSD